MTAPIDLLCPVKPYELDRKTKHGFNDLVQRVTTAAVLHNSGRDLMLYVYLAGVYHGVELQKARDSNSDPKGEDPTGAECASIAERPCEDMASPETQVPTMKDDAG